MELAVGSQEKDIREIEDIIDIQKAKGALSARQVVFELPEGGLRARGERLWPSDSDVTVVRVAAARGAGDGTRPRGGDPCSMVNLATLVQPTPASKPSLLLPLSSWQARPPRAARLARFLRLYFCPCCPCLYELERADVSPSVYLTAR